MGHKCENYLIAQGDTGRCTRTTRDIALVTTHYPCLNVTNKDGYNPTKLSQNRNMTLVYGTY